MNRFLAALVTTVIATTGVASAERTVNTKWLNTKWLNTKWLNTKWLNTAEMNAIDGSASFYNPWTGETLPNVTLDKTTFVSSYWVCDPTCRVVEKRGQDFVGTWSNATLHDGTPSYAYIEERKESPDAYPDTVLYKIQVWAPDGHDVWGWRPACLDMNDDPTWAIPLDGAWNDRGARVSYGGNTFTWSCISGALGKCAASGEEHTLGYTPWRPALYYINTPDELGTPIITVVDGQRSHQTCSRMIRADYCGDGKEHTDDGNRIEMRDYLWQGYREEDENWGAEAMWNESGAAWIACTRDGSPLSDLADVSPKDPRILVCRSNKHRISYETGWCNPFYLPVPEVAFPYNPQNYYPATSNAGPGKVLLGNRTARIVQ